VEERERAKRKRSPGSGRSECLAEGKRPLRWLNKRKELLQKGVRGRKDRTPLSGERKLLVYAVEVGPAAGKRASFSGKKKKGLPAH